MTVGETFERRRVSVLSSRTNQSAAPAPKPRAYMTLSPTSCPTQPRACKRLMAKIKEGRKVGLARLVRAMRTPRRYGDASSRVRSRSSCRGRPATPGGPAVAQAQHDQHHDTPPLKSQQRPGVVRDQAPERPDQRGRRKRGQQRIADIHRRGTERQGHTLPCLPRQGLADTGDRKRAWRNRQDEPHHKPHQQCGHHGWLLLSERPEMLWCRGG